MLKLGLAQVTALQRLFESFDSRTALEEFVNEQKIYHSKTCAEEMIQGREDVARENAYFAKCYGQMLDELKKFTEKQAER